MSRSRRDDDHYDGTGLAGDTALAVALMHDERTWRLNVGEESYAITTKKTRHELTVVTDAPPHLRGFVNGPAVNLERWLRTQGDLHWERLT